MSNNTFGLGLQDGCGSAYHNLQLIIAFHKMKDEGKFSTAAQAIDPTALLQKWFHILTCTVCNQQISRHTKRKHDYLFLQEDRKLTWMLPYYVVSKNLLSTKQKQQYISERGLISHNFYKDFLSEDDIHAIDEALETNKMLQYWRDVILNGWSFVDTAPRQAKVYKRTIKVFLADDCELKLSDLKETLEDLFEKVDIKIEFTTANNGEDGLMIVNSEDFDIVITDGYMPDKAGGEEQLCGDKILEAAYIKGQIVYLFSSVAEMIRDDFTQDEIKERIIEKDENEVAQLAFNEYLKLYPLEK